MRIVDYVFRCLALAIVWAGLAVPAVSASLFLPTDLFDWTLGIVLLMTGAFLTVTIWCGPELVRSLMPPRR